MTWVQITPATSPSVHEQACGWWTGAGHILFDVRFSSHGLLAGTGMVYSQLVYAYWRMSSITSNVSGLFVKGHCAYQ